MATHTMNHVTTGWNDGMALAFVSFPDFTVKYFMSEDEATDYARKYHAAQLLDFFLGCIDRANDTPSWEYTPDTVKDYSRCRGEFPRVYRVRDYSAYYPAGLEQVISPPAKGGVVLAASGNGFRNRTIDRTGHEPVIKSNGKRGAVPAETDRQNPLHTAWEDLNQAIEAGEVVVAQATTIPRIISGDTLTPRQVMARAIPAAIARIPQSWGDKDKIALPYGFYLQRKGFDEARVYHPKHRGGIPVGFLGKGWMVNPSHMLRNSLDTIEGIIKKNRLDKPTPPTTPASNPVQAAA